jgi:hypothetical protein
LDENSSLVDESPFLIKKKVVNRGTLVLSKVIIKKRVNNGCVKGINSDFEDLNGMSPQIGLKKGAGEKGIDENYVKTKLDRMCNSPTKEKMTFYEKNDYTLG